MHFRTPLQTLAAAVVAMLLAAASPIHAQLTPPEDPAPELVTDRPDQTESASVVPAGYFQLETGVSYSRDDDGVFVVRTLSGPGTLVRIGVGGRTELRVGWDGWVEEKFDSGQPRITDGSVSGLGDGSLGAKVKLREEAGALPEMAILASINLAVGDDEVTSDELDPSFLVAFAHTLTDRLGLGYNLGLQRFTDLDPETFGEETDDFVRFVGSVALGRSFTERLGGFVEVFGEKPESGALGGTQVSLDGGVTYLVRPNLQLDAYAGAGVSDDAPDWIAGVGLSVRWPR
jgi:hypothetical protein